jgi:hypothetical protein
MGSDGDGDGDEDDSEKLLTRLLSTTTVLSWKGDISFSCLASPFAKLGFLAGRPGMRFRASGAGLEREVVRGIQLSRPSVRLVNSCRVIYSIARYIRTSKTAKTAKVVACLGPQSRHPVIDDLRWRVVTRTLELQACGRSTVLSNWIF